MPPMRWSNFDLYLYIKSTDLILQSDDDMDINNSKTGHDGADYGDADDNIKNGGNDNRNDGGDDNGDDGGDDYEVDVGGDDGDNGGDDEGDNGGNDEGDDDGADDGYNDHGVNGHSQGIHLFFEHYFD